MKHCVYSAEVISVLVCVCVCVCVLSQLHLSITKQNFLFVRSESLSHIPNNFFVMSKSAIMEVELNDRGKCDKTTDGGIKNTI